ncbi:MAG: class I adenylate-forming enzyme family protein [Steroidobacteraceae bacterium]
MASRVGQPRLETILLRRIVESPETPLLVCGPDCWSTARFATLCANLARRLQALPGSSRAIGVSAESSRWLPFMFWSSVLAGLDVLLIPAQKRSGQLSAIAAPLGLRAVFSDVADLAPAGSVFRLDDLLEMAEREAAGGAGTDTCTPLFDDAAFVFQTSGTEGEPKTVRCEYWQFAKVIDAMLAAGALEHARGRQAFISQPLVHSYGLSVFLEYCAAGATIVLPAGRSALGPVGDLMTGEGIAEIDAVEGVPFFWSQFAKLRSKIHLPRLRHLGVGGGRLDPGVMQGVLELVPNATVSVRYGLTETPSVATHKLYTPPHEQGREWRSSGRVIPAYDVVIRAEDSAVAAPGEEGEIVVSGDCVSAPDGVLRTGDLGYFDARGELFVTGRRSAFIKRRGYRLSPEFIEAVAGTCDGILDCRARGRDDRLILEVVAAPGRSDRELLAALREQLPDTMVPDMLERVEQIPRTYSGKIKRS